METEFKVDQKVVYPSQGVGIVKEIFEKTFKDEKILYYKIYIEASDMMVMIPVSKAQDLGIRQIVSKEEAEEALKLLSDEFEPITSDWKLRYQMNLDLLKKGTVKDIATIVRCLYNRSKVKELPIMERKLYESAKKLLEDEISFALGKTAKEIEAEIDATNNEQEKALAEISADEQVWQMKVDSEETQNALLQTNIDNYQKMVESNIAPSHTYGYKS